MVRSRFFLPCLTCDEHIDTTTGFSNSHPDSVIIVLVISAQSIEIIYQLTVKGYMSLI